MPTLPRLLPCFAALTLLAACQATPAAPPAAPAALRPPTSAALLASTPGAAPPPAPLHDAAWSATRRFIVMGDTGDGSPTQHRVAEAAQRRCDLSGGCDGVLLLGDNIYPQGAHSDDDALFELVIDRPYRDLRLGPPPLPDEADMRPRMPLYVVLGNHDLGGPGLNSGQVAYYLRYAQAHDWFIFPDELWERQLGHVHLIGLHTNPMAYLGLLTEPHADLVRRVVATSDARWIIAFGHHPYRSNGRHGNAGSQEGLTGDQPFLGGALRAWIEAELCPNVDLYFAGHDHNRQWLASPPDASCATRFAVSGAGAKTTPLIDRGNTLDFAAATPGFLLLELTPDTATASFCDADGEVEWQTAWTKPDR